MLICGEDTITALTVAAFTEQHWSLHVDILAHGLWAGIAVAVAARLWKISCGTAVATVAMAVPPDLA